jgi:hypothetical protein
MCGVFHDGAVTPCGTKKKLVGGLGVSRKEKNVEPRNCENNRRAKLKNLYLKMLDFGTKIHDTLSEFFVKNGG